MTHAKYEVCEIWVFRRFGVEKCKGMQSLEGQNYRFPSQKFSMF